VLGTSWSTTTALQWLSRRQSLAAMRRRQSSIQNQPSNTHLSGLYQIPTTTSASPVSSAITTRHSNLMSKVRSRLGSKENIPQAEGGRVEFAAQDDYKSIL
jgi:hypothetical protein